MREGAGDGECEDPPPSSILSPIVVIGAGLPPLPPDELVFGESAEAWAGGGWAPCCRYQGFRNIITSLVLFDCQ